MKPNPEIFDITKRKFHNVLQGVGSAELTEEDKSVYEWWCQDNLVRYWRRVVAEVDVVVIDDPQREFFWGACFSEGVGFGVGIES